MHRAGSPLGLLLGSALLACTSTNDAAPSKSAASDVESARDEVRGKLASVAMFEPNDVVLDHQVKTLSGDDLALSEYRGKALLVVNTASECGHTPQYAGLQQVYATYRDRGLEVLAFPSNDFGGQEPGTNEEIREYVDSEYQVTFSMFDKVHAKGPEKSAIYKTLTEDTGKGIKGEVEWNFTKFLVDPQGKIVARFSSETEPTAPEILTAIEQILPKKG